jgi:ATP-dependent Clp protease ATP-binding subunit ClpB
MREDHQKLAPEHLLKALMDGDAGQVYLDQQTAKVLDEAEKIAKKAGDSFVPWNGC